MNQRLLPLCLAFSLFAVACGSDDLLESTAVGNPDAPTTTATLAPRGWLEGDDLVWSGGVDGDGERLSASPVAYDTTTSDSADRASSEEDAVSFDDISPVPPINNSPLNAGAINDAEDIAAFLDYRTLITDAGVVVRPLDLSDSTVFTVIGLNGLPVLDAQIEFWHPADDRSGSPELTLPTTADGSVRFVPGALAESWSDLDAVVRVGDMAVDADFEWGVAEVTVNIGVPGGVDGAVPLDVHFVLDATGSMGDEIARLRDNMTQVAEQVSALPSAPDVRFGMTVYRDEGDTFVTRNFDLTGDLQEFLAALDDVVAEGGGDYAEAMDEALADALALPAWRRDGAVQLMFVLADAPPQVNRQVETPYTATAIAAAKAGVKIFPVAASGTDDQAEYAMRDIAFVTGGRFVFLSCGVDGTATGGSTDVGADDFDELPLDQLVVQLIADELGALNGTSGQSVPATTTIAPTTTFEQ
jgi:hypothetical protein